MDSKRLGVKNFEKWSTSRPRSRYWSKLVHVGGRGVKNVQKTVHMICERQNLHENNKYLGLHQEYFKEGYIFKGKLSKDFLHFVAKFCGHI